MRENFAVALKATLEYEGGYVNHPRDPGGATNFGITQAVYDEWRHGLPSKSVKDITPLEYSAIYRKNYWDAIKGDELPSGVDFAVWDFAVNSGPSRAAKYLQRIAQVPQDGKIGPATLAVVKSMDPATVVQKLCDDRVNFLMALNTFSVFGRGWTRRVGEVRKLALEMAAKPLPPFVEPPVTPPVKVSWWRTFLDVLALIFNPNTGK